MIQPGFSRVAACAILVVLALGANAADAGFKGTNGLIAFDSWTGTSQDIGVFDPSGDGGFTMLTTTPDFSEQTPDWSPDGTKVVYMGHPQFNEDDQLNLQDIWVMDADGQHKIQLTNTPRREEVPAWTADGRIVYCGQAADDLSNWDIYVMNADGSGVTRLTSTPGLDCWPSPAPAGNKLAFTSVRNGVAQVNIMNLNGGGLRKLTEGGYITDWSPTGNDIVLSRSGLNSAGDPEGDADIWMIHSDGTGLRRLTNTPDRVELFPVWSPDGTQVAFEALVASGVFNIFAVDVHTGAERLLLADSPPVTWSVAAPSWQPVTK